MPPEILALIDQPLSLIAVLFVGALFGMLVEQFVSKQRRAEWKRKSQWRSHKRPRPDPLRPSPWAPSADALPASARDAADQLRIVMGAQFTPQPLLNKSEARLFKELDRLVIARNSAWQVMAQVSLGEILRSKDADAFACINSKRVDLLIVDGDCQARHAI